MSVNDLEVWSLTWHLFITRLACILVFFIIKLLVRRDSFILYDIILKEKKKKREQTFCFNDILATKASYQIHFAFGQMKVKCYFSAEPIIILNSDNYHTSIMVDCTKVCGKTYTAMLFILAKHLV